MLVRDDACFDARQPVVLLGDAFTVLYHMIGRLVSLHRAAVLAFVEVWRDRSTAATMRKQLPRYYCTM